MSERGFFPMSAAAALMLIITISFAAHVVRSDAQRGGPDWKSAHELVSAGAVLRSQLDGALRYAGYRALYEVSGDAWRYSQSDRMCKIESLVLKYFEDGLSDLSLCNRFDPRLNLELPYSPPAISLNEAPDGNVLLTAKMPEGSRLCMKSRDGATLISIPLGDISVMLFSRYFLLQDLMENFFERLGDANTYWGVTEYMASWAEAWGTGVVNPNSGRSAALFEAAWALHELNTMGSADCSAAVSRALQSIVRTPRFFDDGPEYLHRLREWVGDSLETLSAQESRIEGILRDLNELMGQIYAENGASFENAAEELALMCEELISASGGFLNMLEREPLDVLSGSLSSGLTQGMPGSDLSPSEQILFGFDGLVEKLENIVDLLKSSCQENGLGSGLDKVAGMIEEMLGISDAVRSVGLTDWLGNPVEVPVYLSSKRDATLPRLRSVLERMSDELAGLESMLDFPDELEIFSPLLLSVDSPEREDVFSLFPPEPLRENPGVSAYHDLSVGAVSYSREDPVGQAGLAMATPIPLWFIGVTVWWGQWETVLKLENDSVEAIFDSRNRTIPAVTNLGGAQLPLKYRWKFTKEFRIRVAVTSLKPFVITFDRLVPQS